MTAMNKRISKPENVVLVVRIAGFIELKGKLHKFSADETETPLTNSKIVTSIIL